MPPGLSQRESGAAILPLLSAPLALAAKRGKDSQSAKRVSLGLLTYCFDLAKKARAEIPGIPDYNDPLVFIQEAARIGANAVQIPFGIRAADSIRSIRELAERSGVK